MSKTPEQREIELRAQEEAKEAHRPKIYRKWQTIMLPNGDSVYDYIRRRLAEDTAADASLLTKEIKAMIRLAPPDTLDPALFQIRYNHIYPICTKSPHYRTRNKHA